MMDAIALVRAGKQALDNGKVGDTLRVLQSERCNVAMYTVALIMCRCNSNARAMIQCASKFRPLSTCLCDDQVEQAITILSVASAQGPKLPQAWFYLGAALARSGNHDMAALCFFKTTTLLDPDASGLVSGESAMRSCMLCVQQRAPLHTLHSP